MREKVRSHEFFTDFAKIRTSRDRGSSLPLFFSLFPRRPKQLRLVCDGDVSSRAAR